MAFRCVPSASHWPFRTGSRLFVAVTTNVFFFHRLLGPRDRDHFRAADLAHGISKLTPGRLFVGAINASPTNFADSADGFQLRSGTCHSRSGQFPWRRAAQPSIWWPRRSTLVRYGSAQDSRLAISAAALRFCRRKGRCENRPLCSARGVGLIAHISQGFYRRPTRHAA